MFFGVFDGGHGFGFFTADVRRLTQINADVFEGFWWGAWVWLFYRRCPQINAD